MTTTGASMIDLTTLTDDEARDLLARVYADVQRRDAIAQAPAQAEALAAAYAAAIGRQDGDPWQAPTGAHDAYPLGITVTHGGKTWESLTAWNTHEPGVSGWREVVAEGYAAWVQPTGAHDAYAIGDRVSFEGSDYESLIAGNTWSPTAYPQGWRKL